MNAIASAWLLELSEGSRAAIAPGELVHLHGRSADLYPVPGAPAYCRQVLMWQQHAAPVLDLGLWLRGEAREPIQPVLAVVAHAIAGASTPGFAALLLRNVPRRIEVAADDGIGPGDLLPAWARIACSAFRHQEAAVPILDLDYIFSGGLTQPA